MDSEELNIKERRTIEAVKKDLMGPSGKLGLICKYLGSVIYHQGIDDFMLYTDPYDIPQDHYDNEALLKELPEFGEDGTVHEVGWLFDGLSSGMHLEIKYLDDEKKLTVHHKGEQVYSEVAGELEAYAPAAVWEDLIEKLYKIAKTKKKAFTARDKEQRKGLITEKQESFLQKMRKRWGI